MTNIAMENPKHNWSFLGKSSIFMGHLYHGYVTNNQRVKKNPKIWMFTKNSPHPQPGLPRRAHHFGPSQAADEGPHLPARVAGLMGSHVPWLR